MNANYPTLHWELNADEIEAESFRIIETECPQHLTMLPEEWKVARRLIHTSADIHIADTLVFQHGAIESGLKALRKKSPIYCDSNMIKAGLSLPRLQRMNPAYTKNDLICYISDDDILLQSKKEGRTRALCAAEKAKPILDGSIILIGNAPLALARIARFILEEKIKPSLVVGMPVGFVNVVESKELLEQTNIPAILLKGRRGGSPLALTTIHALIESAGLLDEGNSQ